MTDIVFSGEALISYILLIVIGLAIPVGAALIWRFGFKKGTLAATFAGAGMFLVFAMILESLLHQVMLPLVSGNLVLYCVYGALAAGIFEETARFLCFRFLMKKQLSAENAVSYGIGHGGFEMISVLVITSFGVIVMAVSMNSMGAAEFIKNASGGNEAIAAQLTQQMENYAAMNIPQAFLSVYERIVAMAFHISMSVIVMEAVKVKGRIWLYPAAVVLHALLDTPAVLYQSGVISIWLCYIIVTIYTALICFIGVKRYRFLKTQ